MRMPYRFRPGLFLATLLIPMSLMLSGLAAAQSSGPAVPVGLAAPAERTDTLQPRLRVSGAETPVRLVSLAVLTEIQSGFAESSLDMVFHNPNGRTLEGELEFPLNQGQEISGLALDIDGELRLGLPVSKARGQEVFDEVARRKVDPALLEATRGNAYKLRVYPLPAGGKRRVVVRIMQPLKAENGQLHYRLPLTFADTLDSVSVEALVISSEGQVKAEAGNLGLRLEQDGTVFRGRAEHKNISPEGWLDISLPASESLAASLSTARWQDKLYFSAAAHLSVPDKARNLPNLVTILWDASGSGSARDQAKEFTLLDSYFTAFGSGKVRLLVLRDKAEAPQDFIIKNGDWNELKTAIHNLVYDGATNLTGWTPAPDCREFLLFSDGLANYRGASGKAAFPPMDPQQRLFAINSATTADYAALRALAVRGAIIDLTHESPELALAKLLREGTRVSLNNAALAGAAEAVLAPESAYLSSTEGANGIVRLAGWLKRGAKAGQIPVRLVFPDGTVKEVSIKLPAWDDSPEITGEEAPLQARLWGRYAIAGLEADYRTNKKAIARLGEQLGIISRETSLIVLETAEDYARYEIKPPASLQAKVEALGQRFKIESGGERRLPEGRLLAMWQEKVKWWESTFDQKPKPEKQGVKPVERNARPQTEVSQPASSDNPASQSRPAYYETAKVYTGERISLDFQNEDIQNIIRLIGEASGKSIVASDAVSGKVTIKLQDVPWDQALDIVLSSRNLGVEESGNVLTVYDLASLRSIQLGRMQVAAESEASPRAAPPRRQLEVASGGIVNSSRIQPSQNNLMRSTYFNQASLAAPDDLERVNPVPTAAAARTSVGVQLKPWISDAPYIARMREAKDDELYAIYLDERPDYLNSSAFFIDVADRFFERGLKDLGLRVLSNLAEMQLENRQVLRMLAYRLMQAGEMAAALPVLEQVRGLAPYEPQSLRDIATVKAALGQTQEAVDLLYETAQRQWSERFGEINTIALTEMNALISTQKQKVKTEAIDSRLIKNLPSDIRVVLSWDMDNTDMDLWVTAPDGEAAYYGHRQTRIGGRMSSDCTQGYGPEEFMLKKAIPGVYRVEVNYYGHSRQTIAGEVTMIVTVISKFGTPQQKEEKSTLRLKNTKDKILVAEFSVKE